MTAMSGECQAETDLSGECQAMTAFSGGESGYNCFVWGSQATTILYGGGGGRGGSFVLPQAASSIDWLGPCCPADFLTYFSLDI